ncbi:terminase small subunit [Brucella intermedia]|uniref:terminase small subunit n=1 Tax=Brucella intermedia TaxID=94625 RepID=UPI000DD78107|nr:terminase small subunit [Brucella intermedia]WGG60511.1 terminase small subunit [Brucella intermedia]
MPVLKNARHEAFAQELAKGKTADEAYKIAGFKPNRGNAATLKRKQSISKRVSELLEWEQTVERKATEKAIDKLAITKERVLAELAKIGFSDIRKAIKWHGSLVTEEDNPDGGDVLVVKNVVTNNVQLVSSDEIDDDTAAAIAEISQNSTGGIKLKLHDKKAALVDIGKHLGMFIEKHEHSGGISLTVSQEDAEL